MRKWIKFSIDYNSKGIKSKVKDQNYIEHSKAMGGYEISDNIDTKEVYLEKYFLNSFENRLSNYYDFISKRISKEDEILSLACGSCTTELQLQNDGYNNILCSDLDFPASYNKLKTLFPDFKFFIFNAMEDTLTSKKDTIIVLNLIYLFNQDELLHFFKNIKKSLKNGGQLVIDSAGSPDNWLSYFIHDILLPFEMIFLKRIIYFFKTGKWTGVYKQDFAYRRNDDKIIEAAKAAGFELIDKENYAFYVDFNRTMLIGGVISRVKFLKNLLKPLAKKIPYSRMFLFKNNE